jgi:hypothetical protein
MTSENVKWWHRANSNSDVVVRLPALSTMDGPRRPLDCGQSSEKPQQKNLERGPPSKQRYFAVTENTYSSLQSNYDTVVDAQKSGTARYWKMTVPVMSVENEVPEMHQHH